MSTFKENMDEKKEGLNNSFKSLIEKIKLLFKRLFRLILILIVFGGGAFLFWCNYTYSSGTRTGFLIKISEKGYVFKTCEGQLNLGGVEVSAESGITGNVWNFTVKDNALHQELQKIEGQKVTLHYDQVNKSMPWQGDTDYFITKVDVVK